MRAWTGTLTVCFVWVISSSRRLMTVADNLYLHKTGEKVGFSPRADGRFEVKVSSSVPSLQKNVRHIFETESSGTIYVKYF